MIRSNSNHTFLHASLLSNASISKQGPRGQLKFKGWEQIFRMALLISNEGSSCSLATMLVVIPSCSILEELSFGKALHSFILKCEFISSGVLAVNTLIMKPKTKVTKRPAARIAWILRSNPLFNWHLASLFLQIKIHIKRGSDSVIASSRNLKSH